MRKAKQKKLESKGWKFGTVEELLNLNEEESSYIEIKLKLSQGLKYLRKKKKLTQEELALRLKSSQSRVAKMEAGDSSVSIDLLVRSLLSLGTSKENLGQIISG